MLELPAPLIRTLTLLAHRDGPIWSNMMQQQQRRDEILAKKAKLAELKRQRELRSKEISANRQSIGSSSDVSLLQILEHNWTDGR